MALFDRSAETYDEWCNTPLGSWIDGIEKQLMLEVSKPQAREKVLDIGCGTGIYSLLLASQGADVTGIDISPAMLQKARKKAENTPYSITFIEGDIHYLPFTNHTFDLIISNIVLEFVDSPNNVLIEALRALKPGGRLVVGMIGGLSSWASIYRMQGDLNNDSVFTGAHFFTVEQIKSLFWEEPSSIHFGLYIAPDEFVSPEQATALEIQRSRNKQEERAGFIVVQWTKSQ